MSFNFEILRVDCMNTFCVKVYGNASKGDYSELDIFVFFLIRATLYERIFETAYLFLPMKQSLF